MSAGPPLARDRFDLPQGLIYLDGNSLGALPCVTRSHLDAVMREQWGRDLITSWNKHGWIDLAHRVAARLAPIVGARPNELLITNSTSVTLFKLLGAAVGARGGRSVILSEEGNFPTDLYVAQGLADLLGLQLRTVAPDRLEQAIDSKVAVVTLTHVDFRSARRHDMAAINSAAHAAGALTVWDLSHSAGAIALDLSGSDCDLAVGCGYKYLNGGPGAPAFCFVAERLHDQLRSPIQGWMGDARPFDFDPSFVPAEGIQRFATGTPPILALAALDCGVATYDGLAMSDVERASASLSEAFIAGVGRICDGQVRLESPAQAPKRGSHVVFSHPQAYAVMQALIERSVIGDFRAPDLLRFGFCPLYNSLEEIERAAAILGDILRDRAWDDPRYHARAAVT